MLLIDFRHFLDIYWLVVSNVFLFSISYMGCHPSHWQTHIFQDGYIKPPTRDSLSIKIQVPFDPNFQWFDLSQVRWPYGWPSFHRKSSPQTSRTPMPRRGSRVAAGGLPWLVDLVLAFCVFYYYIYMISYIYIYMCVRVCDSVCRAVNRYSWRKSLSLP